MRTDQHTRSNVVAEKTFPCTPDQVGPARRWAAAIYADAGADPDVCRLLVSELATNSVLHAQGESFQVRIHREALWVEVCDESYDLPRRQPTTEMADDGSLEPSEHGRGLELLESLAPGFETCLMRGGKAVRFQPLSTRE